MTKDEKKALAKQIQERCRPNGHRMAEWVRFALYGPRKRRGKKKAG
jgi:hypothetical protein